MSQHISVLLVDDHSMVRTMLRDRLELELGRNRSRIQEDVVAEATIDADAGRHLFGGGAPARDRAALENLSADARSREIGGTDEAVMTSSNDENLG